MWKQVACATGNLEGHGTQPLRTSKDADPRWKNGATRRLFTERLIAGKGQAIQGPHLFWESWSRWKTTVIRELKRTGKPVSLSSATSLARPSTTMPFAPSMARRSAMIPPQTAFFWPSGCLMTTMVPGTVRSAQCMSFAMFPGGYCSFGCSWRSSSTGCFGTKRTVDAAATVGRVW